MSRPAAPGAVAPPPDARGGTQAWAFRILVLGIIGTAGAYVTAFFPPSVARFGPWIMAVVMPVTMFAMMVLGAVRRGRSSRALAWPFALVLLLVAGGFLLALSLPAEPVNTTLWLGLPRRAAVILFGVGLLPLFVLPVVYAATFEALTLTDADIARVRAARRPGGVSEDFPDAGAPAHGGAAR